MGACPPPACPPPACPPPPPPVPGNPPIPALLAPFSDQRRGSLWVQGSTLRYVTASGAVYGGTGVAVGAVDADPGSIWVEDEGIHYVDEFGQERVVQHVVDTPAPVKAVEGSVWIESGNLVGRQLSWISETGERRSWWNGF